VKLQQILKRSLRVCFDFDGSKFASSSDLLFVKYFIHQLSHCEFIQPRKCQMAVFQNHGACGQAFPFLASPPLPHCFHQCCTRPNFCAAKKAKNASKGRKTLRKRLLRRLRHKGLNKSCSRLYKAVPAPKKANVCPCGI